jgi:hypothetical protein
MTIERQAVYTTGPRFFLAEDGKHILFAYRIDSGNEIGPREATDPDKENHSKAWAAFQAGQKPEPVAAPPKRHWRTKEEPAELVAESSRRNKIAQRTE